MSSSCFFGIRNIKSLGVEVSTVICDQIVNIEDFLVKILIVIRPEILYSLSRFITGIVLCMNYRYWIQKNVLVFFINLTPVYSLMSILF